MKVEVEGRTEGGTPQRLIPTRGAVFGVCSRLPRGLTAPPPTPGPPLPLVLQRLFEALQDLERCHRQLPPAAPAPLELQT